MMIAFRNLPGIQRVEEIFRHPGALSSENRVDTMWAINDVSNALFCVTRYDTFADDGLDDDSIEAHELQFDVCDLPWSQARPFWEAIGWDISDGGGDEHPYVHYFARQIVAAVRGAMLEAKFCPAGDGKASFDPWGDRLDPERSMEDELNDEVARFFDKRGRSA